MQITKVQREGELQIIRLSRPVRRDQPITSSRRREKKKKANNEIWQKGVVANNELE